MHFSGESRTVIDGPFAETKELVAGYWMWKCKSKEEAIEWVKRRPNPMPGEVSDMEIRPIFDPEDFGAALTPELRAQEDRLRAERQRINNSENFLPAVDLACRRSTSCGQPPFLPENSSSNAIPLPGIPRRAGLGALPDAERHQLMDDTLAYERDLRSADTCWTPRACKASARRRRCGSPAARLRHRWPVRGNQGATGRRHGAGGQRHEPRDSA